METNRPTAAILADDLLKGGNSLIKQVADHLILMAHKLHRDNPVRIGEMAEPADILPWT